MRVLRLYLPVTLLWLSFSILLFGARGISLTSDEPAHIAVGYALLARGQKAFWLIPHHGHPPLLNALEAALIYVEKPDIPLEQLDGWPLWTIDYMRAFTSYLTPVERTEMSARMPIILLTVLLGAVVFRWGKDMGHYSTGLIALLTFCFDPTLLAHGRLATTDVGTITLGTASLYLAWRWLHSPSWKWAVIGGLLGLTMLAKGSGVLWTAAIGLMILWKAAKERGRRTKWFVYGLICVTLSLITLWAGYAFTWGTIEEVPGTYPAPAHWNGLISQALSAERRWVFAIGVQKRGNWWWYFPLAFLIKNPLPLFIGLGISGVYLLRRPAPHTSWMPLVVFPLLYTGVAIKGGMNIGYRHMLPVHPFIYLAVGEGMRRFWVKAGFRKRLITSALGLWYMVGTLRIFPYEIAYFNELIGGPQNGHYYLVDSNMDWGQGYKALRRYLDDHPGPIPKIAYHFTYISPSYYGISYEALPPEITAPPLTAPFHPLPGRYVISVTSLQQGWLGAPLMYAWFRQAEPTAKIGFSFLIYDLSLPPLQWVAQCSIPVSPLSDQVIANGFGQENLRRVDFNCINGWIYPLGGESSGVYALHYDLLRIRRSLFPLPLLPFTEPRDPFLARRLGEARLSVDMHHYTSDHPAFTLYEQGKPPSLPHSQTVVVGDAEKSPNLGTQSITPITLSGPLTFLGANGIQDGPHFEVETWWQVTEGPITRPLSIMGHLLNGEGEVIGQNDGLGVEPVVWQPGDIIVQRHRFPRPLAGTELWLRTGAYWLDTMERWPVSVNEIPGDAIFVSIER